MITKIPSKLESTVRKALYEYDMISDRKIVIALSGGKDSLTLLAVLKQISGKGFPPLQLHAVHVKGAFSCGPGIGEPLIKLICQQLEVPLTILESTQKQKLECYSCSRTRRQLLFQESKRLQSPLIAFGHHQDDANQTLLLNLLHKGEFAGLLPKISMNLYGITIIRPLILVREKEIIAFAQSAGFSRISCRCPVGQNSMRKKVKDLIQEMEHLFPNVDQNLAIAAKKYGSQKANRNEMRERRDSNPQLPA